MKKIIISLAAFTFTISSMCSDPSREQRDENYIFQALTELGVEAETAENLLVQLKAWHPLDDGTLLYHSYHHSLLVALTVTRIANHMEFENNEKLLLLIAGLFHDVDPRQSITSPKVVTTIKFLEENEEARSRLESLLDFSQGLTREMVFALIKFTDFNPNPVVMEELMQHADDYAAEFFPEQSQLVSHLGKLLSFADKISMYTVSEQFSVDAVTGLKNEIDTGNRERVAKKKPSELESDCYFDAPETKRALLGSIVVSDLHRNTIKFLNALKSDEFYQFLPEDLKSVFEASCAVFTKYQNI